MHRKQSGFTIVELVVVIILLGILAATALPRFINIDDEAHESAFAAVNGGLQTGVSMFHAKWVALGQPAADTPLAADFNGLRTNAAGFPYGLVDNSGSGSDVDTSADCQAVFTNVMQGGSPTIANTALIGGVAGAGVAVDYVAVEDTGICEYYYTAETTTSGDTIRFLSYDSTDGSVVANTTNLP